MPLSRIPWPKILLKTARLSAFGPCETAAPKGLLPGRQGNGPNKEMP
jgi:hypothetical protein